MKITMPQKVLLDCINKGAFSVVNDNSKVEISSFLLKSVTIDAKKDKIIFENCNQNIYSYYELEVKDDIEVKEEGKITVLAKDFFEWLLKQKDCTIALKLNKSDQVEFIKIGDGSGSSEFNSKSTIKKTGVVEIASRDKSKTGSRWKLDNYEFDSSVLNKKEDFKDLFNVKLDDLVNGMKNLSFIALTNDYEHLFDSVSFQNYNNKVYMLSTDRSRCGFTKLESSECIDFEQTISLKTLKEKGMEGAWKKNILIPCKIMSQIVKILNKKENVLFARSDNKISVKQGSFYTKFTTIPKDKYEKFMPVSLFIEKDFEKLCDINKEVLVKRLNSVLVLKSQAVDFSFSNDKLLLSSVSKSGRSPCKANLNISNLKYNLQKKWNGNHILDFLRAIKDEDISIMIPKDEKKASFKIGKDDEVCYFSMEFK